MSERRAGGRADGALHSSGTTAHYTNRRGVPTPPTAEKKRTRRFCSQLGHLHTRRGGMIETRSSHDCPQSSSKVKKNKPSFAVSLLKD